MVPAVELKGVVPNPSVEVSSFDAIVAYLAQEVDASSKAAAPSGDLRQLPRFLECASNIAHSVSFLRRMLLFSFPLAV